MANTKPIYLSFSPIILSLPSEDRDAQSIRFRRPDQFLSSMTTYIPQEAYCVVPGSSICSCAPAFEA